MNKITRKKIAFTLVTVLAMLSTAIVSVSASGALPAPQGPQTRSGGPIAVVRLDPTVSSLRVPPPQHFSELGVQSATISVTYLPGGSTNVAGTYCYEWPNDAKAAFNYAASIWESLINSSVPININACWAELDPGVLGYGGSLTYHKGFSGGQSNTWYPAAAANALAGSDLNNSDGPDTDGDGNDADADMIVAYSRTYSWYYGTDGNTPPTQLDFASVVLHEICHGLGFAGLTTVLADGTGYYGGIVIGLGDDDPTPYDRFTENESGAAILSYTNGSTALGTQLTSGKLYFDGTNANAGNGGTRPKLFAPSTWMQGSSYSHLDEIYNGTENALMTYALASGESNHDPGPVASGVLQDIGWTMAAAGPMVTSITPRSGYFTETVSITNLAGTHFQSGATVKLTKSGEPDINAINVAVVNSSRITCDFNLNGAATGKWNVVVTNPDLLYDTLTNGFSVRDPSDIVFVYLPLVGKRWPPVPYTPVLNAISNSDGDGNYTVSWNPADLADTYVLEEDDNASFSSPATSYAGAGTSWNASDKAVGTYYYRVKANNSWGSSGWSNVQSVSVTSQPSGPNPGFWENGVVEFDVTSDRAYVDDFAISIYVPGCGGYKITHMPPEPISNSKFSFTGSYYANGTFSDATHASGKYGLDHFYIYGCGYVTGGPYSWTATWQHSAQSASTPLGATGHNTVEAVMTREGSFTVVPVE